MLIFFCDVRAEYLIAVLEAFGKLTCIVKGLVHFQETHPMNEMALLLLILKTGTSIQSITRLARTYAIFVFFKLVSTDLHALLFTRMQICAKLDHRVSIDMLPSEGRWQVLCSMEKGGIRTCGLHFNKLTKTRHEMNKINRSAQLASLRFLEALL